MNPTLLIGCLAFLSSLLGCLQVINLAERKRLLTGVTSCCIAASQLHIYRLAPGVDGLLGTASYIFGGLLGSQLALWMNRKK